EDLCPVPEGAPEKAVEVDLDPVRDAAERRRVEEELTVADLPRLGVVRVAEDRVSAGVDEIQPALVEGPREAVRTEEAAVDDPMPQVGVELEQSPDRVLLAVLERARPEPAGRVDRAVVEPLVRRAVRQRRDLLLCPAFEVDPIPPASQRAHQRPGVARERDAAHVLAQLDAARRARLGRVGVDGSRSDVDPEELASTRVPHRSFAEDRRACDGDVDHRTAPTFQGAISSAPKPRPSDLVGSPEAIRTIASNSSAPRSS